jgi:hypothetical protein
MSQENVEIKRQVYEAMNRGDWKAVFAHASPGGSTAELEIRIGELWTFRDGKLVRGQGFGERMKALEAAGLSEQDVPADS